MLGKLFGKRKAPAQSGSASAEGAAFTPNPMFQVEVLAHLFQQLNKTGSFQDAFADHPAFAPHASVDGLEVCKSAENLTGMVLDHHNAGVMFGAADVMQVAAVSAGSFFKNSFGVEPDWNVTPTQNGTQKFSATLLIGTDVAVELDCSPDNVDPLFTGKSLPGVNLVIQIKRAE